MPGLNPTLLTHKLAVSPDAKPIKQTPQNFRQEIQLQIKEEIKKLVGAGFTRHTRILNGWQTLWQ